MSRFFNWCRRYVSLLFLLVLGLFAYVIFFDENSYGHLSELNKQKAELEAEIDANRDSLRYYQELNDLLESSPDEMERIARERYYMQGENEDVYVVK